MVHIGKDSLAEIRLILKWRDSEAEHTEVYDGAVVNFWRHILPRTLFHELMGKVAGESVDLCYEAGTGLVGYNPRSIFEIDRSQFTLGAYEGGSHPACLGRFYPKGVLRNITGVFPQNREPFRCVGISNGHVMVDFNHPLVERELLLQVDVKAVYPKLYERGGSSVDWIETLALGPGMQSRWRSQPTDFFAPGAFERIDATPDSRFYGKPRMVHHIDTTARKIIKELYGRLLVDRPRVLDLMSSWVSHLPQHLSFDRVAGLGLNSEELNSNSRLSARLVQDLNQKTGLPFENDTFDAVICTASIEYLINPLAIFQEVHRVLAPDGIFVIAFSNRWFEPKAIRIWSELHEFERMGLVMEYFLRSGNFKRLNTLSQRGLPRDPNDKYYGELLNADPVYAVWGSKFNGLEGKAYDRTD